VAGRHKRAGYPRDRADDGQPVRGDRPEAGLLGQDPRSPEAGGDARRHPPQPRASAGLRQNVGRIDGQGVFARQAADIGGAIRPRIDLRRGHLSVPGFQFDEQRNRRGLVVEDEAVPLDAIDGGQRQPAAGQQRPRTQGDDDGVGGDFRPVHDRAHRARAVRRERDALDASFDQPRAALGSARHHRLGESRRMDLRRRVEAPELSVHRAVAAEPVRGGQAPEPADILPGAGDDAEGLDPAIAPVAAEAPGQFGMQIEAPARQGRERRAVAPVARQEPARLAGSGVGDARALHDEGLDAAKTQEIGKRRPDDAAAADQDLHAAYRSRLAESLGPRRRRAGQARGRRSETGLNGESLLPDEFRRTACPRRHRRSW